MLGGSGQYPEKRIWPVSVGTARMQSYVSGAVGVEQTSLDAR